MEIKLYKVLGKVTFFFGPSFDPQIHVSSPISAQWENEWKRVSSYNETRYHFVRFERFYLMKEYDLVAIEAKLKQNKNLEWNFCEDQFKWENPIGRLPLASFSPILSCVLFSSSLLIWSLILTKLGLCFRYLTLMTLVTEGSKFKQKISLTKKNPLLDLQLLI
jgi:hypothetical protein